MYKSLHPSEDIDIDRPYIYLEKKEEDISTLVGHLIPNVFIHISEIYDI